MANKSKYSPDQNAGLGLIYRLNRWWDKADRERMNGHFDEWNHTLDVIFSNLCYREKLKLIRKNPKDATSPIIDIRVADESYTIREIFKAKIAQARGEFFEAVKVKPMQKNKAAKARDTWYNLLVQKDLWLRKYMMSLGLYLKEFENNPAFF